MALGDIPLKRIDGAADTLAAHRGKVLLIVNVASKCGLTPQYEGLEKLYENKRASGLEVLGFPANNFRGQEPGTDTRSRISARPRTTCNSRCSRRSPSRATTSIRSTKN